MTLSDDFNNIDKYKYANLIIFNLGFLPGSNKKIKTQDYTSESAILKAYSILDGILLVACYIQHEGGYDEYLSKHYGDYMKLPPKEKQVSNHELLVYWRK